MTITREELIERIQNRDWRNLEVTSRLFRDVVAHLQSSHEAELMAFVEFEATNEACDIERKTGFGGHDFCLVHGETCPCIAQRARELLNKIKGE